MTGVGRRRFLAFGLLLLWPRPAGALTVYVAENGQVTGPFDDAALRDRLGSQARAAVTLVWMQGMADWTPATQVPALAALIAGLPAEPPLDARYLAGSWTSDDHPIQTDNVTVTGRVTFVFTADGKLTGHVFGSHMSTRPRPQRFPGDSKTEIESIVVNGSVDGDFKLDTTTDGFTVIDMKGKITDRSRSPARRPVDWDMALEVRRIGPDLMRTRYGVNYRRSGS